MRNRRGEHHQHHHSHTNIREARSQTWSIVSHDGRTSSEIEGVEQDALDTVAPQSTAQTEIAAESKLVFSSTGLFSLGAFVGKSCRVVSQDSAAARPSFSPFAPESVFAQHGTCTPEEQEDPVAVRYSHFPLPLFASSTFFSPSFFRLLFFCLFPFCFAAPFSSVGVDVN